MKSSSLLRVHLAIDAVLAEVESGPPSPIRGEAQLWSCFVGCLLTSGVNEDMAVSAHRRLESAGLLEPVSVVDQEDYRTRLTRALSGGEGEGSYRFPASRSAQIAESWSAAFGRNGPGLAAVLETGEARATRNSVVETFPGMGMKQASLFILKSGYSDDLVALDRHILRYLAWTGRWDAAAVPRSRSAYNRCEAAFRSMAQGLGVSCSSLDVAVWVVMTELARVNTSHA